MTAVHERHMHAYRNGPNPARNLRAVLLMSRMQRLSRTLAHVNGLVRLANEDADLFKELQPDLDHLVRSVNLLYETLVLEAEVIILNANNESGPFLGLEE